MSDKVSCILFKRDVLESRFSAPFSQLQSINDKTKPKTKPNQNQNQKQNKTQTIQKHVYRKRNLEGVSSLSRAMTFPSPGPKSFADHTPKKSFWPLSPKVVTNDSKGSRTRWSSSCLFSSAAKRHASEHNTESNRRKKQQGKTDSNRMHASKSNA